MSESVASLMMRAKHAMQGTQRPTKCGQKKEKPAHLRTGASARQRQTGACLGVTTPTTNACLKHSNFLKTTSTSAWLKHSNSLRQVG